MKKGVKIFWIIILVIITLVFLLIGPLYYIPIKEAKAEAEDEFIEDETDEGYVCEDPRVFAVTEEDADELTFDGVTYFDIQEGMEIVVTLDGEGNEVYSLYGECSYMTAEQADSFWAGVAKAGDAYVIIKVWVNAGETIVHGDKSFTAESDDEDYTGEFYYVVKRLTGLDEEGEQLQGTPTIFTISYIEDEEEFVTTLTVSYDGVDLYGIALLDEEEVEPDTEDEVEVEDLTEELIEEVETVEETGKRYFGADIIEAVGLSKAVEKMGEGLFSALSSFIAGAALIALIWVSATPTKKKAKKSKKTTQTTSSIKTQTPTPTPVAKTTHSTHEEHEKHNLKY